MSPIILLVRYMGRDPKKRTTTTYYFNRDYDYTTYVYGSGSVSYQYSSQFGVTQYTGGFTCNTGSASASIVIDKRP